MKVTLTWLFGVVVVSIAVTFAYMEGLLSQIYGKDQTHITFFITGLLILKTLHCGLKTHQVEKSFGELSSLSIKREIEWLSQSAMFSVSFGALGTIIGLMMMSHYLSIELAAVTQDSAAVARILGPSIGTALTTTFCGMVSALLLGLQSLNIRRLLGESIYEDE